MIDEIKKLVKKYGREMRNQSGSRPVVEENRSSCCGAEVIGCGAYRCCGATCAKCGKDLED